MSDDEKYQKEEFVKRVDEFKKLQKDERIKEVVEQYKLYYLRLTNIITSDLPQDVLDDVRSRVKWILWDTERKARIQRRKP